MSDRHENILDRMEHSNRQERWGEHSVSTVFHGAGILPGECDRSKFQSMQENRAAGAKQSHEVHKNTPISWNSYHTYKSACIPLATFAKQEAGLGDIYKLTPQNVADYLQFVVDIEVDYKTFDKNCSAIEKLCTAINEHNHDNKDFHSVITEFRHSAKDELPAPDYTPRAYENPQALIDNLPTEKLQIAAELQYSCGLRVSDACHITPEMVKGLEVTVHSKNGQYHTVTLSPQLSERLNAVIKEEGQFSVNRGSYDYRLEQACNATGQEYHSTHGLRHNYAQDRFAEYTSKGMTFYKALQAVSEDMGHHRPDITKVYLR